METMPISYSGLRDRAGRLVSTKALRALTSHTTDPQSLSLAPHVTSEEVQVPRGE